MFGSVSGTLPYVRSGKLRTLGISSPQRWPTLPPIPTVADSAVPGFEASTCYGTLARASAINSASDLALSAGLITSTLGARMISGTGVKLCSVS